MELPSDWLWNRIILEKTVALEEHVGPPYNHPLIQVYNLY